MVHCLLCLIGDSTSWRKLSDQNVELRLEQIGEKGKPVGAGAGAGAEKGSINLRIRWDALGQIEPQESGGGARGGDRDMKKGKGRESEGVSGDVVRSKLPTRKYRVEVEASGNCFGFAKLFQKF